MQEESRKEPFMAGALIKGIDTLGRPVIILEGNSEVNASFIFGEMGRLCEWFEKENALLRGEFRARDAEIFELSQHMSEVSSKRDKLRERVALIEHQLLGAKKDNGKYKSLHFELVAALLRIKVEAEVLVSSHGGGTIVIDSCAERVFEGAGPILPRTMDHTWTGSLGLIVEGVLEGSSSGVKNGGGSPKRGDAVEKGPLGDL
uniref:Uncharacterized protein n=2 Tax=Nicotiana TaxID=4085 RepID=A0A1S4BBP5_TOBAC|nr:PREDICTED: uncharacterized protein LOC104234362 [Nicotiana sylvestris]XP_016486314.1 PREDICTED: uncharacterized protein LOC107806634 [Nicotiana tabacum]